MNTEDRVVNAEIYGYAKPKKVKKDNEELESMIRELIEKGISSKIEKPINITVSVK